MKRTLKRLLSLFLAAVMLFGASPIGALAEVDFSALRDLFTVEAEAATHSGTCGDNLTWTLNTSTGALTISGTGAMTDWSSSSSVPWYSYRSSVKSVTIGNSVTSIGEYAFYWCDSLTSVTIPDSVTSIGNRAFDWCKSLTSITVDKDNAYYSNDEYGVLFNKDKTELIQYPIGNERTSYTIPDSVTSIASWAFSDCNSLTSVTIPDSVTSIGNHAFYSCRRLTSVTIPDSVTSIGDGAFRECTSLTSVTIPDSVTSIGNHAFYDCYRLTSMTIPDSVTSIGDCAFEDCKSLTSVTIGDSVTNIGERAFLRCANLTSITIPDSVTSIGGYVFYNCASLTSVTIGYSVTSIGYDAFSYCYSLTSVTIGDSVTSIGNYAFQYCYSLTSVTVGDGVTSIGDYAFRHCESLTDVYYNGTEYDWNKITIGSNNDPLKNAKKHFEPVSGTCGDNLTWTLDISTGKLTISGTGDMKDYSSLHFDGYIPVLGTTAPWGEYDSDIKAVEIKNGVTSVGNYAFYNCDKITKADMSDSITSIGSGAFSGTALTSITIPKNVKEIGELALLSLSLKEIKVSSANKYFSSDAFGVLYNKNKTELLVYPAGRTVGSYTIPSGTKKLADYAFYGASALDNITIPKSINNIWPLAYAKADLLESFESYDDIAFDNIYYDGTVEQWENLFISDYEVFEDLGVLPYYENITFTTPLNYKDKISVSPFAYYYLAEKFEEETVFVWSTDSNGVKLTPTNQSLRCNAELGKTGQITITAKVKESGIPGLEINQHFTVKYTWWQWIIIILLFGWIWY